MAPLFFFVPLEAVVVPLFAEVLLVPLLSVDSRPQFCRSLFLLGLL